MTPLQRKLITYYGSVRGQMVYDMYVAFSIGDKGVFYNYTQDEIRGWFENLVLISAKLHRELNP